MGVPLLSEAALLTILIGAVWLLIYRRITGSFPPRLGQFDLRAPGIFIGCCLALAALMVTSEVKPDLLGRAFPVLYVLLYLILIYAAVRNWHLWGMRLALLGIVLNLIVIAANGGRMPVDLNQLRRTGRPDLEQRLVTGRAPRHAPLSHTTRLAFLADVRLFTTNDARSNPCSVGDIFITLGACWLILQAMGLVEGRRMKDKSGEHLPDQSRRGRP